MAQQKSHSKTESQDKKGQGKRVVQEMPSSLRPVNVGKNSHSTNLPVWERSTFMPYSSALQLWFVEQVESPRVSSPLIHST